MIKKKEIIDAICHDSGLKKFEARAALEAMLSYVHDQIEAGEEVQIPPLGKIKIVQQNAGTVREKTIYKLVLSKPKEEDDAEITELLEAAE